MTPIPVFLITPTGEMNRYLRRYAPKCLREKKGTEEPYCNATAWIDRMPEIRDERGYLPYHAPLSRDDPRWPKCCDACGRPFKETDAWQTHVETIYRREDDPAQECTCEKSPVGAIYDATWLHDYRTGPDGRSLHCRLPDGSIWFIDGRASNCTLPLDSKHRCWVRHGTPGQPDFYVDKGKPGESCSAGAGSIQGRDGWHGYLTKGCLQLNR